MWSFPRPRCHVERDSRGGRKPRSQNHLGCFTSKAGEKSWLGWYLPNVVRRRLSQIFLKDIRVVSRIVSALPVPETADTILEIGAGGGAVTKGLLRAGYRVVAVEVDEYWAHKLESLGDMVHVVNASILDLSPSSVVPHPAVIVGSLPYHLSGAILRWLVDKADEVRTAVIVLQNEVVRRIAAPPGSSERSLLSVIVQSVYEVKPLFRISPGSFTPSPEVWSRAIALERLPGSESVDDVRDLWEIAAVLFRHRRKMIGGSLQRAFGRSVRERADRSGLDLTRRPETLTLAELRDLGSVVSRKG